MAQVFSFLPWAHLEVKWGETHKVLCHFADTLVEKVAGKTPQTAAQMLRWVFNWNLEETALSCIVHGLGKMLRNVHENPRGVISLRFAPSSLQKVIQGRKEYTPPPRDPSFLGLSPDPEVTEQKKLWCIPFSWENKGEGYTPPERRVYTIEPQIRKKKKRGVSTVVVYTFFFPVIGGSCCIILETGGILFREYCFGRENSLSSVPNVWQTHNLEIVKCRFSKCRFSAELKKSEKIFEIGGQHRKTNPKSLEPAFSLCRRAGIDAALAKAAFFFAGAPTIENKIEQNIQTLRWRLLISLLTLSDEVDKWHNCTQGGGLCAWESRSFSEIVRLSQVSNLAINRDTWGDQMHSKAGGACAVLYHDTPPCLTLPTLIITYVKVWFWNIFLISNGPTTVSGSTVSNTELSEFFGAHWVLGSELSEFLSAYNLCVSANSPSSSQNSPSLPQTSVRPQWVLLSETVLSKQYSARFLSKLRT